MRSSLMIVPLLLAATPALAQPAPPAAQQPPAEIEQALADPAMADKLANVMQALSKVFMNLPVGEVQAAVEGRKPTAAEKKLTLGEAARREDPNFQRDFQRQMADAKPMVQQSMKVLHDALPGMMQGLGQAQQSLERAVANMPQPGYPKR